jgi:flagellar transcriptional activator FlhD
MAPAADTPYSRLPIKENGGCLHNESIDNANATSFKRSPDMNPDQILNDIRETNLSYLMLAQTLIRENREEAMFRLGLSQQAADRLASLSSAQVLKIASGNTLVCRMNVSDDMVWSLITQHGKGMGSDGQSRLQTALNLAQRAAA